MAEKKAASRRVTRKPGRVRAKASLRLVRIDATDGPALEVVFDDAGVERRWRMDASAPTEVLALLLRGKMRRGLQVVAPEGSVSVGRAKENDSGTELCVDLGMLEICIPMRRSELKQLKTQVEAALGH